jgi:hypothetical protein
MKKPFDVIPIERVAGHIILMRGKRVILDRDLAVLYGVTTSNLNKAVRRNRERFPSDFMFQLKRQEANELQRLRFQSGSLKHGQHVKFLPYAFSQEGVAMLSSVLNSECAVRVNIAIMRAFVKLREMMESNLELARKFAELEARVGGHDEQIAEIIEAIHQLMDPPAPESTKEIGFHIRESPPPYRTPKR